MVIKGTVTKGPASKGMVTKGMVMCDGPASLRYAAAFSLPPTLNAMFDCPPETGEVKAEVKRVTIGTKGGGIQ